jgi:hypothetical protein
MWSVSECWASLARMSTHAMMMMMMMMTMMMLHPLSVSQHHASTQQVKFGIGHSTELEEIVQCRADVQRAANGELGVLG